MRTMIFWVAGLALITGCSTEKPATAKKLTAREHHEILASEPLPGATVVGRSLDVSDQMNARNARLSAELDSLPR